VAPRIRVAVALIVLLLIAAGLLAWRLRPVAQASNLLALSGRLEGYPTDVGAKAAGRAVSVAVREGAQVRRGQVLVRLDDAVLRAQLDGANARVASAREAIAEAAAALRVLASQVHEAGLGVEQAGADASGRIAQASASVAAAEASVQGARAALEQSHAQSSLAHADRDRFSALARSGDVPQQRADQAETAYRTAVAAERERAAAVSTALRQATAARGALALAQSSSYNSTIRGAQQTTLERQRAQLEARAASARAQLDEAQAASRSAAAQLGDLTIASPIDGVVVTRSVEPGEIVAPGRTLLTLVDLDRIYMRGYVAEGAIGRVRVGQRARVRLDSDPERPLDARVTEIDAQASFTPQNIYFKDDRVQQVFGVKLELVAPGGYAKPGMPADAEILLDDAAAR